MASAAHFDFLFASVRQSHSSPPESTRGGHFSSFRTDALQRRIFFPFNFIEIKFTNLFLKKSTIKVRGIF